MLWFWLSFAILLVVIELVTLKLVAAWYSASALITGITLLIVQGAGGRLPVIWQAVIFAALGTVLLIALRKITKKLLKKFIKPE
jgi:membrane protein implicated in regulation of membrane protease activity